MHVMRTGLQGNGKTLNTIKEVDTKAAKESRVVYYNNIRDFKPDHPAIKADWRHFDDPLQWHKLPPNAIIVIDEAQQFFRVRRQGSPVPEYASALETMRHQGHELHCITQAPSAMDTHFRKLCNSHIHYTRGHGGKIIKRWQFERVNLDVEKREDFSNGESSRIFIDSTYFGCYKGFQAGTPDFSGKLAKPVLVRVVAKQLFYGTGTPLAEIPGLHSQNMRDKPCRIVSAAGNFACDLFRQNFRGFRLTTPTSP